MFLSEYLAQTLSTGINKIQFCQQMVKYIPTLQFRKKMQLTLKLMHNQGIILFSGFGLGCLVVFGSVW